MGKTINKLATPGILVSYTDLEHWGSEEGYPSHLVSVSAIKDFDEALEEAMAFARQVQMRPEGRVHAIRVLSDFGPSHEVDLAIPEPPAPSDSNMRMFMVAWELEGREELLGPLHFFEPCTDLPTVDEARTATAALVMALREEGYRVLYVSGFDGRKWRRLGEDGYLPRILRLPRGLSWG